MKRIRIAWIVLFVVLSVGCTTDIDTSPQEIEGVQAINPDFMDLSVKPGDDFYQYANGTWLASHPVPESFGRYGAFTELWLTNNEQVQAIVSDPSLLDAPRGSVQRKIADFYASGMDTLQLETLGLEPIQPILDRIAAAENRAEVLDLVPLLHASRVGVFFNVYADQDEKDSEAIIAQLAQGGLGMTDRDYYLSDDNRTRSIQDAYDTFITTTFSLAGFSHDEAQQARDAILKIETRLADASMTPVERRDLQKTYNPMDVAGLLELAPHFPWKRYFTGIGADAGRINVRQPAFFEALDAVVAETAFADLKTYLTWHTLRSMTGLLSKDFQEAGFAFYGTAMTGTTRMQPRWRQVLGAANGTLGEAIGQEYVVRHFPPEAKERMLELVSNLQQATAMHIQDVSWMTPETKSKALEKLQTMSVKIGYPDEWTDFSELEIRPDAYAANVLAGRRFHFTEEMARIGKPVDRSIWFMHPQTVNAYYSPSLNEIVFPAGILQPPFFWLDGDEAVNYGGIGMVIAHEITHAFDDQGRQFDATGNMADWWTPTDAEQFKALTTRMVKQYSAYTVVDTVPVNGELTLGENIADNGGLTIAYDGLQLGLAAHPEPERIDGFTQDQRFLLSFASIWRTNSRPEALLQQVKEDPHSPANYRVIGSVVNFDPFYTAFQVEPDQAMYLPPEKRLNIW